jgi:hypothetical protein
MKKWQVEKNIRLQNKWLMKCPDEKILVDKTPS